MSDLGFRRPTRETWLEPDPIMSGFVTAGADGTITPVTGDRLLERICAPQLADAVPVDVQRLFETARGAMCYGYFFYPLFTLAAHQMFRVVEAAITARCKALQAATGVNTFERKIKFLAAQGALAASDAARLDILRRLRNDASHPRDQDILTPGMALDVVALTAQVVSGLFRV